MKVKTSRFGEIEVEEKNILDFKQGLLAFDHLRKFLLLDIPENPAFKWLQSLEDPEITFLLVDPFLIKTDYSLELADSLQDELQIEKEEDVLVYTTVTVPKSGFKDATTNLVGPIIINWKKKRGKQVILEQEGLSIKYPLFPQNTVKMSDRKSSKKASCGG